MTFNKPFNDIFAKDATELRKKRLWLFDMDGTIYNEDHLFDGTFDLLNKIISNGGRYVFVTNNSSKSLSDYVKKMNSLGIMSDKDSFFTSTQATIMMLKRDFPNKLVFCLGTSSMINELFDSGIQITTDSDENVGVVVVGFDTELTSDKIKKACFLLKKDIPFIATNCDLRCPVSFGYIPDCGSICQMLTNATDRKPFFLGKPNPLMVDFLLQKFNYTKEETVFVGDRLYTDIATGNNAGITSICVLTGEATLDDINRSKVKPSFVFKSVKDIII